MSDKKRKPVVGEIVHYVSPYGSHIAALVTDTYSLKEKRQQAVLLIFYPWAKHRTKNDVCYSKDHLNRTWHYMDDHPYSK